MGFNAINLVNDRTFFPVYNAYRKKYGTKSAEYIWEKAGERYEELLSSYQDKALPYQSEIRGMLLKGVAIYRTLLRKHPQEEAFKFMEDGLKEYTGGEHKKIKKKLSGKLRRRIFVIRTILEWKYRKQVDRGYSHDEVQVDSNWKKMRVMVYDCPYKEVCMAEGVPELTRLFCDMQRQYYENIPLLTFHMDQTKVDENGLKCCDLYYGMYQPLKSSGKDRKKKQKDEWEKKKEKWKKRFFFI